MKESICASIVFGYSLAVRQALSIAWAGRNDNVLIPCAGSRVWPLEVFREGGVPVPYDAAWPALTPDPEGIAKKIVTRTRLIVIACPPDKNVERLLEISSSMDVPLLCEFTSLSKEHLDRFLEISVGRGHDNAMALIPMASVPYRYEPCRVPHGAAWLLLTHGKPAVFHPRHRFDDFPGFCWSNSGKHEIDGDDHPPSGADSNGLLAFSSPEVAAEFSRAHGPEPCSGCPLHGDTFPLVSADPAETPPAPFPDPGGSFGGIRITSPGLPVAAADGEWTLSRVVPYFRWVETARRLRLEKEMFPLLSARDGQMWYLSPGPIHLG